MGGVSIGGRRASALLKNRQPDFGGRAIGAILHGATFERRPDLPQVQFSSCVCQIAARSGW
jgi:hypothetical protein